MELVNALYAVEPRPRPTAPPCARRSSPWRRCSRPFAPHVAEELWHEVRGRRRRDRLLADEPWPAFDPALVAADTVTMAVQVNGKLRGEVQARSRPARPRCGRWPRRTRR